MEIQLAPRFYITERSRINNSGNYSFHNEYEYYSVLEDLRAIGDDNLLANNTVIASGKFRGHPNSNEQLFLINTSVDKVQLYKDDKLVASGKDICVWDKFYTVQDEQNLTIYDLETNNVIHKLTCQNFSGYNSEKELLSVDGNVFSFNGKELKPHQDEVELIAFEKPYHSMTVTGSIKDGALHQTYKSENLITRNLGVVNERGLYFHITEGKNEKLSINIGRYYKDRKNISPKDLDAKEIFKLYRHAIWKYKGYPRQKKEIEDIQKAYNILYNEDIKTVKSIEGLTVFEELSLEVDFNFRRLRDFYKEEFLNKNNFSEQKLSIYEISKILSSDDDKDGRKMLEHFLICCPHYCHDMGRATLLAQMVIDNPGLIDAIADTDLVENLKIADKNSTINKLFKQRGKTLYYLEDFRIAPNKLFLEELRQTGFGNHDKAFQKLCNNLSSNSISDFERETTKELLRELIANDKEVVNRNSVDIWAAKSLVKEEISQDKKIVEMLAKEAQNYIDRGHSLPEDYQEFEKRGLFKTQRKQIKALDLIEYKKKNIDVSSKLYTYDVDFSDFRDVAATYHLSCDSKTTFLNEMLIYGRGEEAAYALSHGASPFQKIEFARGKKSGMPFTGLFFRTKRDNYAGVKELMVKIGKNLDSSKGRKIISDIEKSLGFNLRSDPVVVDIMNAMTNAFIESQYTQSKSATKQTTSENDKTQESRLYREEHLAELDKLDERNRLAQKKEIDEYKSLFNDYSRFCLEGHYHPYSEESLQKLEENIAKVEGTNSLIEILKRKLEKNPDEDSKSLNERLTDLGYKLSYEEKGIRIYRDSSNSKNIQYSDNTVPQINQFVTQKELELQKQQEEEKQRREYEQKRAEAKILGLPSDVQIWHRVGAGTMCGEGWVIKSDGSFREPDKFTPKKHFSSDGFKYWEQILPDEVVISWKKGSAASKHNFEVIYMPEKGLSKQQKEQILKIEEKIQNAWKDSRGMSSGEPSPSVGYGWNLCDRKKPLLRDDEYNFSQQDTKKDENVDIPVHKEIDVMQDHPINDEDLATLLNHFGGSYRK